MSDTLVLMSRTTIAIQTETRARLKAGAESESQTIDAFLQTLLDEHERTRFWRSFGDVTPATYAAETRADGDMLDESFLVEAHDIATEER